MKPTVEAIRPGTTLADISEWKISELIVLRPNEDKKRQLGDILLNAIKYVGTPYDFSFNNETTDMVTCSELVYQSYRNVKFRESKQAGRWTINPDDVAVAAGALTDHTGSRPFSLIYLNYGFKVVPQGKIYPLFVSILEKAGSLPNDFPE